MKEWKLPSWRNAIQAATRFSNVQLVSSLKGSSKVHRYSHQVLYRSHRVYKTEKWLPMHYPQEHRFHVLILKCLDTLYSSQCKNIGTLCAIETTKFSLNELCPLLCGYHRCGSNDIARKHSDRTNFRKWVTKKLHVLLTDIQVIEEM